MSSIVDTINYTRDFDKLVEILLEKNGYVLTKNDYEKILYNLKTVYYEDENLENILCNVTKKINWKIPQNIQELVKIFQENKNTNNESFPLLGEKFSEFLLENADKINALMKKSEKEIIPFTTSIFGLETLNNKYLLRERSTQYQEDLNFLWLRVALFIIENGENTDWNRVEKVYNHMKMGYYTHATPTLFNSGTKNPQLASCFMEGTKVLTINGYKNIEMVTSGDYVWTHKNRWKRVLQCHTNDLGSRKILKVKFKRFEEPIFVTEDHKFLVKEESNNEYNWKPIENCTLSDSFYSTMSENDFLRQKSIFKGILYNSNRQGRFCIVKIKKGECSFFEEMMEEYNIPIVYKYSYFCHNIYHFEYSVNKGELIKQAEGGGNFQCYWFLQGMNKVYHSFLSKKRFVIRATDFYIFQDIMKKMDWEILHFENYKITSCSIYYKERHLPRKSCFSKSISMHGDDEIEYIKPTKYNNQYMKVYTLGVEEDHSYTVGSTIVKNCFLMGVDDTIESIFGSIGECAKISKFAGGIGLHIHSIRSSNSYIHGTNGTSNGIIPMLRVYNNTARYIDQGGGKRNGAFAIYLEVWHSDILEFLELKKNIGQEELRARDLFYALWICDRFMQAVEKNKDWYLFNPSDCPNLSKMWGDDFNNAYKELVRHKKYIKKLPARELWKEICKIQIETGTPYILFKDNCNRLSNQQNLGTISSSNLCCEILQYSDYNEYAVCNLASIALPKYVERNPKMKQLEHVIVYGKAHCFFCKLTKYFLMKEKIPFQYIDRLELKNEEEQKRLKLNTFPNIYAKVENQNDLVFVGGFEDLWNQYFQPVFNYTKLGEIVEELVENLNNVIDKSMYPLEKCKKSNLKHRPMGLGVQGLADVFMSMLISYDSVQAQKINKKIFETMYYHALKKSCEIAKRDGTYESYQGSPLSKGKFHFELYPDANEWNSKHVFLHDWEILRQDIQKYGVRNSLFIAPMPTASTSQILNNTESFEPLTSNFYVRRTQNGEFYIINRYLQRILKGTELWDKEMHEKLIFEKGSIQNNTRIPKYLKEIFRTVWEIPQKHCIDMASDRQRFIDQSQSMNIYLTNPSIDILTKIIFYGWKKQLKTGSYYVRTRALTSSQNFYLDAQTEEKYKACESCSG